MWRLKTPRRNKRLRELEQMVAYNAMVRRSGQAKPGQVDGLVPGARTGSVIGSDADNGGSSDGDTAVSAPKYVRMSDVPKLITAKETKAMILAAKKNDFENGKRGLFRIYTSEPAYKNKPPETPAQAKTPTRWTRPVVFEKVQPRASRPKSGRKPTFEEMLDQVRPPTTVTSGNENFCGIFNPQSGSGWNSNEVIQSPWVSRSSRGISTSGGNDNLSMWDDEDKNDDHLKPEFMSIRAMLDKLCGEDDEEMAVYEDGMRLDLVDM